MNEGVILIGRQQALATTGRAENEQRPAGWCRTEAGCFHIQQGQFSGSLGGLANRRADDASHLVGLQGFLAQGGGEMRQAPLGGPQLGDRLRRGDIALHHQGTFRALAQ